MKKLSIITAFVAILCFGMTTAMAQNNNSNPEITKFVQQYFPKANVLMVNEEWDEYEVRLSDGTQIEFTRKPEWKKIDCEHSTIYPNVPAKLVPEQITNYLNSNFPNQSIVKIEKKRRGWEIELNNELEIGFNKNFVVTKFDD
jgi:hypothetical protein